MKSLKLLRLAAVICALTALSLPTTAQEGPAKHHHYKLIDMGSFGGPQSYINGFEYLGPIQDVNDAGMLAGWADTSEQDPYQNFCFNYDGLPCYASHAFLWEHGVTTDLGTLPGGASSAAAWISANGLIAGASQNGETDPLVPGAPEDRAVLWRNGKIIDLGTLPEGGYESGAEAVNSHGQVVGWAFNTVSDPYSMGSWSPLYNFYTPFPYPYQNRAFLWEDEIGMLDLGTLGTGTDAYAMAINERGQVIGISYTNSTPNQVLTPCSSGGNGESTIPTQDPFLWENGHMIDLGSLGGTCGQPHSINNNGQVVGYSDTLGDQEFHAFLWTKANGMQDLGTLGGSVASATMINSSGEVVGGATLPGDLQGDAFLWNGTMHDLGALEGCAYAWALNDQGQVVGNWGGFQCSLGAFLWEDGGPMVDLASLIVPVSNWTSLGVVSINNRGEIAGVGTDPFGNGHAILLIPCDGNHPGIEGCDYSLAIATADVGPTQTTQKAVLSAGQDKLPQAEIIATYRQLLTNRHFRFTRAAGPQNAAR
jgi:probable HAF family extracellular repeat protein